MVRTLTGWFLMALILGQAVTAPLQSLEPRPLGVVSELGQRLAARARPPALAPDAAGGGGDARLPLPTPQELDAIKKVAQILVMLGEQVIPTIIGDRPAPPAYAHGDCGATPVEDEPNDPVNDN